MKTKQKNIVLDVKKRLCIEDINDKLKLLKLVVETSRTLNMKNIVNQFEEYLEPSLFGVIQPLFSRIKFIEDDLTFLFLYFDIEYNGDFSRLEEILTSQNKFYSSLNFCKKSAHLDGNFDENIKYKMTNSINKRSVKFSNRKLPRGLIVFIYLLKLEVYHFDNIEIMKYTMPEFFKSPLLESITQGFAGVEFFRDILAFEEYFMYKKVKYLRFIVPEYVDVSELKVFKGFESKTLHFISVHEPVCFERGYLPSLYLSDSYIRTLREDDLKAIDPDPNSTAYQLCESNMPCYGKFLEDASSFFFIYYTKELEPQWACNHLGIGQIGSLPLENKDPIMIPQDVLEINETIRNAVSKKKSDIRYLKSIVMCGKYSLSSVNYNAWLTVDNYIRDFLLKKLDKKITDDMEDTISSFKIMSVTTPSITIGEKVLQSNKEQGLYLIKLNMTEKLLALISNEKAFLEYTSICMAYDGLYYFLLSMQGSEQADGSICTAIDDGFVAQGVEADIHPLNGSISENVDNGKVIKLRISCPSIYFSKYVLTKSPVRCGNSLVQPFSGNKNYISSGNTELRDGLYFYRMVVFPLFIQIDKLEKSDFSAGKIDYYEMLNGSFIGLLNVSLSGVYWKNHVLITQKALGYTTSISFPRIPIGERSYLIPFTYKKFISFDGCVTLLRHKNVLVFLNGSELVIPINLYSKSQKEVSSFIKDKNSFANLNILAFRQKYVSKIIVAESCTIGTFAISSLIYDTKFSTIDSICILKDHLDPTKKILLNRSEARLIMEFNDSKTTRPNLSKEKLGMKELNDSEVKEHLDDNDQLVETKDHVMDMFSNSSTTFCKDNMIYDGKYILFKTESFFEKSSKQYSYNRNVPELEVSTQRAFDIDWISIRADLQMSNYTLFDMHHSLIQKWLFWLTGSGEVPAILDNPKDSVYSIKFKAPQLLLKKTIEMKKYIEVKTSLSMMRALNNIVKLTYFNSDKIIACCDGILMSKNLHELASQTSINGTSVSFLDLIRDLNKQFITYRFQADQFKLSSVDFMRFSMDPLESCTPYTSSKIPFPVAVEVKTVSTSLSSIKLGDNVKNKSTKMISQRTRENAGRIKDLLDKNKKYKNNIKGGKELRSSFRLCNDTIDLLNISRIEKAENLNNIVEDVSAAFEEAGLLNDFVFDDELEIDFDDF